MTRDELIDRMHLIVAAEAARRDREQRRSSLRVQAASVPSAGTERRSNAGRKDTDMAFDILRGTRPVRWRVRRTSVSRALLVLALDRLIDVRQCENADAVDVGRRTRPALLLVARPRFDPATDRRAADRYGRGQSELRFDRQTGQWVIIAALRQDRTLQATDSTECPLCPGPSGLTSEVPAPDYDVVVFENRFPSLSGADGSPFHLPVPAGDDFVTAPSHGRCEVICFSSDHAGSFAELEFAHARLVVEAWRHRTADLMARPGIEQVFCFENRGEEIGVTLTHPHGQIYGYPYLTPRTERMLRQAQAHRARYGTNLFADIVDREVADGSRIIARQRHVHRLRALRGALAGGGPHLPEQVRAQPARARSTRSSTAFAQIYLDVLSRFDRLYPTPLPYMSALHQYADTDGTAGRAASTSS